MAIYHMYISGIGDKLFSNCVPLFLHKHSYSVFMLQIDLHVYMQLTQFDLRHGCANTNIFPVLTNIYTSDWINLL